MTSPRRLPGIRIDVTPPPLTEALPRMDVAVFVGFASTGPTHRPVAIESVREYAMVFGADAPLAYDRESGERVFAYLGAAVWAFFSNGGQRCWVIRVARTLELEALWRGVPKDKLKAADLTVANRFALPGILTVSGLEKPLEAAVAQSRSVGSWSDDLRVQTALTELGFELQHCKSITTASISFDTTTPLQAGDLIELDDSIISTEKIRRYAIINKTTPDKSGLSRQVEATFCAAFEPVEINPNLSLIRAIKIIGVSSSKVSATFEFVSAPKPYVKISFTLNHSLDLALGQWFHFHQLGDKQAIWLQIEQLNSTPASSVEKNKTKNQFNITVAGQAWREIPKFSVILSSRPPTHAALLTLDLRVLAGQTEVARIAGVGLTPKHRAAWWRQISDAIYYATSENQTKPRIQFPLASLDEEINENSPLAWIPLGVSSLFGEALAPLPQTATALERDGLSRFNAELFLDPELDDLAVEYLIQQTDVIRFLSSVPRELFGIHAALSIGTGGMFNEASIIAVPDALHIGWMKTTPLADSSQVIKSTNNEQTEKEFSNCSSGKLQAPSWKDIPKVVVLFSTFRLMWESSESTASFELEEALRADFTVVRKLYQGTDKQVDVAATHEGVFYYRVIAVLGEERSIASDILTLAVRDDIWVLQTVKKYEDNDSGMTQLLRIQRAVLRLASASGELFAVMGLPRHYRASDAIRYVSRLRTSRLTDSKGFDINERRALSYGAIYHPWIISAHAQQSYPPEGIATGVLAARAARRGAWIAPANELFKDVFALTPLIDSSAYQALQDAQINLIRADARGFLSLSADTLSDEPEWCPINVRRLFILLRRLALRRGISYVFEPNDDVLRRAVERGFTFLLTELFRRGAFAGATPVESFRVVTRVANNSNADRDAGCFFVELQVAPSLPLQFLTIRLSQSGERFTVLKEV